MVQEGLSKIILIVGPTASGKSALALRLAGKFPLEIVNMDTSQLYVGMDIGTAKPSIEDRTRVPHHLFDVSTPDRPLNAGWYVELADQVVREILGRGNVPLFVGGTGLYGRALLYGLAAVPPVSQEVKERVRRELDEEGVHALHKRLAQVDPVLAARVSPNDVQRVTRALEVYLQTGRPLSSFQAEHGFSSPRYRCLKLGLSVPRDVLVERIRQRIRDMMAGGFCQEVEQLLMQGYGPNLRTFKALGYREVAMFLSGKISKQELLRKIETLHLRYAKRQLTWFRKERDIIWLQGPDFLKAEAAVREFVELL